jgi:hypothetical protein
MLSCWQPAYATVRKCTLQLHATLRCAARTLKQVCHEHRQNRCSQKGQAGGSGGKTACSARHATQQSASMPAAGAAAVTAADHNHLLQAPAVGPLQQALQDALRL